MLNLLTSLFTFTQLIALLLFPNLKNALTLDAHYFVIIFAIGSLCFLIMAPHWSKLMNKIGAKKVILIGCLGLVVSQLLLIQILTGNETHIAVFALSRIVYGLFVSALPPTLQALRVKDADEKEIYKKIVGHSKYLNLGRVMAALSFTLYPFSKVHLLVFAITLVLMSTFLMNQDYRPKNTVNRDDNLIVILMGLYKKTPYPFLTALIYTCFIGFINSTLAFEFERLGLEKSSAGEAMAIAVFLSTLMALIAQILLKRKELPSYYLSASLIIGSLIFISGFNYLNLAMAFIIFTPGVALLPATYTSKLKDQVSSDMTIKLGLISSLQIIGATLGSLIASLYLKYQLVINYGIPLALMGLMIMTVLYLGDKKRENECLIV
ncbi:MFS transporter [Halobacteriovorax sp. GB3]|uniref:MFS transporter n=1 Tax=Halobacteriovorax sp. GB3 TaxID=2719615 RepID=UPI00235E7A06|nr:MFS transporter [Halobacteriovorax sp. GB3]MDD0851764.1 MFS transporter [Halobacteriovorax sp. GB3]